MEQQDFSQWLGKTETSYADIITPRLAEEFSATYEGALHETGSAPLGIHWCLTQPIVRASKLGRDGHPERGDFLPPIPLPRRMWAGGSIEYFSDLKVGDTVQRVSTIKDIVSKHGQSGPLCFVTVQHDFSNQNGPVLREQQIIVYREDATAQTPPKRPQASPEKASEGPFFEVTTTTLFRYSAITFNGHRIHYDLAYARDVEHYPDLVIHGPIQATLMWNYATKLHGKPPKHFSYRGLAPATGAQTLAVGANKTANGYDLDVRDDHGVVTMTATAQWQAPA